MKILGIDPGLVRTGYGVIAAVGPESLKLVEAGVVRTSPDDNISTRLLDIYENIMCVIEEHLPDVLVLEKLYAHYKHPTTALLMGHARGVICLASGAKNIPLISYASTRIKKAVTGNGRAGKHQIQDMVKALLGLNSKPEPFDISDALAIAISYVYIEGAGKGGETGTSV